MTAEKAKKIQRYYDYFRLAVIVSSIGILIYLSLKW